MRINRNFTVEGMDPFASIKFVPRTSKIVNPDGKSVFEIFWRRFLIQVIIMPKDPVLFPGY